MSWHKTNPHHERTQFILEHAGGEYGLAELARRFQISRKTGYKWVERYAAEGMAGLLERNRAPHHHPNAVAQEVVELVLLLKSRWPSFGAPKLWHKLRGELGAGRCPAESTVSRILHDHGLSGSRGRRRLRGPSRASSDYGRSNQVWCADFKGWLRLGDGTRCTPLTISDGHSRYLLCCQGLQGGTGSSIVQPIFAATMREYGVPEAIRTDNGTPFASTGLGGLTALSIWWLRLGIRLERGRPGCPQDNGRHERLHRTLKEAAAQPPKASFRAQQRAFDEFRVEYNEERPHEALGGQTPAEIYQPSERKLPERLPKTPEYPAGWQRRAIREGGQMSWQGQNIMVSKVLGGHQVGLEPIGDGLWRVYFAAHELGTLDERRRHIRPPGKTKSQVSAASPPAAEP